MRSYKEIYQSIDTTELIDEFFGHEKCRDWIVDLFDLSEPEVRLQQIFSEINREKHAWADRIEDDEREMELEAAEAREVDYQIKAMKE